MQRRLLRKICAAWIKNMERIQELDLLIAAGFGDVPQFAIPHKDVVWLMHCPHCGGKTRWQGRNCAGTRLRLCTRCGRSRAVAGGMLGTRRVTPQDLVRLLTFYQEGTPIRSVARVVKHNYQVIMKVYRFFAKHTGPVKCGCGRDSRHLGSCSWRRRQWWWKGPR